MIKSCCSELERERDELAEKLYAVKEVLKFYAAPFNWERIEGHTKWASNLNTYDCSRLNCGGGRARRVLKEIEG